MEILNNSIETYLREITPPRDPVLAEMEDLAAKKDFPIIGPLVGRLLYVLAASIDAKRIFELGSGYGYSAYWFALATGNDAKIICTDRSPENKALAETFLVRAKLNHKIDFRVGNGLDILKDEREEFDIIFNDIDKQAYPDAFAASIHKLRKGGLLVSDNVLWSGKVTEQTRDAATEGIVTFNRMIYSAPEFFSTIIPLRDGVSVSIKR